MRTITLLTLAGGLLALGGCASTAPTDNFAAGMGREPTPGTLHMMSRMLIDQAEPEKAEFVLRRVIDEHPRYAPAYVELAELLARDDRPEAALETLTLAEANGAADAVVVNNIGVLCLQLGRHARALEAFERAVELDRGEARYWSNYAVALALHGREDEAALAFSRCGGAETVAWNLGVSRGAREAMNADGAIANVPVAD